MNHTANNHTEREFNPRGFWALWVTQFQGAFSDNVFKLLLIFVLNAMIVEPYGDDAAWSLETITAAAGIVLALPFLLFPGLFGALSDRFSKQSIIVLSKALEVGIMTLGGLALLQGRPWLLLGIFFLMATQSALFGPAKYGILPEILPERRLSWGNGHIQMGSMLAIIIGMAMAGRLYDFFNERGELHWVSVALVMFSVVGLITSRYVTRPAAANPSLAIPINPMKGVWKNLGLFFHDRWLGLAVLGYTYFWFAAAFVQANLLPFTLKTLGLGATDSSVVIATLSVGIAFGALATGFLSRDKIEVGLVPLGAAGMVIFAGLLGLTSGTTMAFALCFALGFSASVFDVPLVSVIQHRSPSHIRGAVMATANMLTWVGILGASVLYLGLTNLGLGPRTLFVVSAAMSAGMCAMMTITAPVYFLRMVLWFVTNTLYRLRVMGRPNIPTEGGALLVANHTSFLDALLIVASLDRPVRVIMYEGIYEVPWVKPLARLMGAIPIRPGGGPREVVQSLRSATEAIKKGDLVCIFAEGQITRTGQMMPFRKGFERIMKGVDAPIIPVHIDEVWTSLFSFHEGHVRLKKPSRIPFPITVSFGKPMSSTSNAYDLRSAIQGLGTEAYATRPLRHPLLHRAFVSVARRNLWKFCIADGRSGALSWFKTLVGSIVLARKLNAKLGPEEMVGVLLPQGVGGTLTNIALTIMGRVPVNLNYTASNESMQISADLCGMKQIITAKAFLEIVPATPPGEAIYLEDIMASVESKDRLKAIPWALFAPVKRLERMLGAPADRSQDDLATIIFSSGSEGVPKGIMLSHYNVMSNIESAIEVFPHKKGDTVVGMLPFFHSFGYTGTLWVVLTQGLSAIYHPNPLEARAIGELIKKYQGKILFSTSTFLQNFIRRCTPDQLASLEYIITGAEKLAPRVRDAFKEKFGVEPLEGYGTTECAPIVSLNLPDLRAPGFFKKGTRRGSIGHPLPGISVRIIDPETREILQNGTPGLLLVKGPNVMRGYLNQPEKTEQVLQDGWYETGDIANIDEDGFITITDRLARFSKLGGEMISHTKVEEALHKVLGQTERVLAVAGVPDENKGERLVVLHTLSDDEYETMISRLDETGLPNLWIPKAKAFYKIDEIPVLGTGKMDLSAVKRLARQLDIGE